MGPTMASASYESSLILEKILKMNRSFRDGFLHELSFILILILIPFNMIRQLCRGLEVRGKWKLEMKKNNGVRFLTFYPSSSGVIRCFSSRLSMNLAPINARMALEDEFDWDFNPFPPLLFSHNTFTRYFRSWDLETLQHFSAYAKWLPIKATHKIYVWAIFTDLYGIVQAGSSICYAMGMLYKLILLPLAILLPRTNIP